MTDIGDPPDGTASTQQTRTPLSEIHPLVSGCITGALAGMAFWLLLLVVMWVPGTASSSPSLSAVILIMLQMHFALANFVHAAWLPFFSFVLPALATTSVGMLLGTLIAGLNAYLGKKFNILLTVIIGTLGGSVFGFVSIILLFVSAGVGPGIVELTMSVLLWGCLSMILSILIVAARAVLLSTKAETFQASITRGQRPLVALAALVMLVVFFGSHAFLLNGIKRMGAPVGYRRDAPQSRLEAVRKAFFSGIPGPYSGRVVDEQTGEPIDGASVMIYWMKRVPSFEMSSEFVDCRLVYTDVQGRYEIPRTYLFLNIVTPLDSTRVVIYQPGYQAYIKRILHDSPYAREDPDFREQDNFVKLARIPQSFKFREHASAIEFALGNMSFYITGPEMENGMTWQRSLAVGLKTIPAKAEFLRRVEWEVLRGMSEERK